jgi:hypothetical protein
MTPNELLVCERVIDILSREGMRGAYDGEQARRFDRATNSIEEALVLASNLVTKESDDEDC